MQQVHQNREVVSVQQALHIQEFPVHEWLTTHGSMCVCVIHMPQTFFLLFPACISDTADVVSCALNPAAAILIRLWHQRAH
jgi:hypothetical protein